MSIYDIRVKKPEGETISLSDYRGRVLLIVNTATGCGFTPQYVQLQELYDTFHDRGLEILDFPCNQFGEQAPGTDEQIHGFCISKYAITFPQMAKVNVIGPDAIPLFKWLSENTAFEGFGFSPMGIAMSGIAKKMDKNFKKNGNIKWNFTKFLIGRDGRILPRFEPTASMAAVAEKVKETL